MATITGVVDDIIRGTSKGGKRYWRIELDSGDTLFCWDFSAIADIKKGEEAEFSVEENDGFLNVTSAIPAYDVNDEENEDDSFDDDDEEPTEPKKRPARKRSKPKRTKETPRKSTYKTKKEFEEEKKDSIIRQTAWKVTGAIIGGAMAGGLFDSYEDGVDASKELREIIEENMKEA